ncbi:MAG TPA: HAMP domain-containing protein [Haliangium sp.]|nr:HAMP domain-containing protein [Haliangium sp.]
MKTPRKTWSWRTRLLVLLLSFAVAPMLGISWWSLGRLEESYETSTQESLTAIARARVEGIGQLIETRQRDVELIASQILPHLSALQEAQARVQAELHTPLLIVVPEPLPELKDAQDKAPLSPTQAPATTDAAVPQAATAGTQGQAGAGSDGQPAVEPGAGPTPAQPPAPPRDTLATRALHEARAELYQVLRLILWDQAVFEELMVIGDDGVVAASTFSGHEDKTAKQLEYFERGLKATYLQPTFLSPITGKLTMVLATPIRGEDLEIHGVLAARLNLERFFRLINDLTGLGQTGELVVGRLVDNVVEIVAPTRHAGRDALGQKIPMGAEHSRALQEATRGLAGAGLRGRDYRGTPVVAAWQPVPSLNWGLVAKIDHEEAMRPVEDMRRQTWLMALILLVVTALSALLVSRELVRPLRALREATDRISRGDLDVQLEIRSNDEIGQLADSFERMVAAIKFFREHARRPEDEEAEEPEADGVGGARTEPQ